MKNNKKLNILIYGESINWSMGPNLRDSFNELGHQADLFDYSMMFSRTNNPSLKNRIMDRLMIKNISNNINKAFLQFAASKKYDLLIVEKGLHISPETLMQIKKIIPIITNWNPDDFFNKINNSSYLLDSLNLYDFIFSPRDHLIEEYISKGVKQVIALDWYCMPKLQKKLVLNQKDIEKYGSDIVFVANWSPRREEYMYKLKSLNIRVWGQGWNKSGKAFKKDVVFMPPIYFPEMGKVVNSSKINLNLLTIENRDTSNFRNYEIPACGAFQLAERSDKILSTFTENKNITCFSDPDEMLEKCKFYLNNPNEIDRIRDNSYQMILNSNNTINDRVKKILDVIEK
jgi:spore maturation protein CgeB